MKCLVYLSTLFFGNPGKGKSTLLNGLMGRTVSVDRLDDVDQETKKKTAAVAHEANGIYKGPVIKVDEKMLINSKQEVHMFFVMASICIRSVDRFCTLLPAIDQSSKMSDWYYNGFSDGIQKKFETALSIIWSWILVFNMNLPKFVDTYTKRCTQVFVSQDMADTADMSVVRGLKI